MVHINKTWAFLLVGFLQMFMFIPICFIDASLFGAQAENFVPAMLAEMFAFNCGLWVGGLLFALMLEK